MSFLSCSARQDRPHRGRPVWCRNRTTDNVRSEGRKIHYLHSCLDPSSAGSGVSLSRRFGIDGSGNGGPEPPGGLTKAHPTSSKDTPLDSGTGPEGHRRLSYPCDRRPTEVSLSSFRSPCRSQRTSDRSVSRPRPRPFPVSSSFWRSLQRWRGLGTYVPPLKTRSHGEWSYYKENVF